MPLPDPHRWHEPLRYDEHVTDENGDPCVVDADDCVVASLSDDGLDGDDVEEVVDGRGHLLAAAPLLERELGFLVRALEPLERAGDLNIPGIATLNGARRALATARGEVEY